MLFKRCGVVAPIEVVKEVKGKKSKKKSVKAETVNNKEEIAETVNNGEEIKVVNLAAEPVQEEVVVNVDNVEEK